jgi:hypothetical protein
MSKRKTTEEFIKKAKNIHGELYDYTETSYIKATEKVKIKCLTHNNIFQMAPYDHLNGKGCKKCGIIKTSESKKYNNEEFVELLKTKHGDAYEYSKVNYIGCRELITITCNKHGDFTILPQSILKTKCPSCVKEEHSIKYRMSLIDFVSKSELVHGGKYDYSEVEYIGCHVRVKILCKKHNDFFYQLPSHHIRGVGCPRCKESKGEVAIRNYLTNNNIKFIPQYSKQECRNYGRLYFDFAIIIENKILIVEFNGIQHYKEVKYFGGLSRLKRYNENDRIKKEYCFNNNIPMLTIKYNELSKIDEILDNYISCNN